MGGSGLTGPVRARPRPGAVLALGHGGARERVFAAFAGEFAPPFEVSDGPLQLALAPAPFRDCHVGERTICLIEGVMFASPAGAAALAEAYELEGERVLPRLRGEFWALIWDRRRGRGLLICDQLGTRSPYWTVHGGVVICASDVPELIAARCSRPEPDALSLAHWLAVTSPPDGATLYSGVRRLQAGHLLELSPGRAESRRYWSPRYRAPERASREDAAARVRAGLERAVSRRMSHAPGVLLSGGLDSGSVAALARRVEPGLTAYSAVFPNHPDVDESSLIDQLGLPGVRVAVAGAGVLAGALEYLHAWGLPPTSPNMFFWTPLFAQAARDGVTVMLDGEGGDEVFGFSPYLLSDHLRHGRLDRALGLAARWPGSGGHSSRDVLLYRIREFGVRGALPPAAHLAARRLRGLPAYAAPWLERRLARRWLESSRSAFAWKELDGPRWWAYLAGTVTRGIGPAAVYEQARRRAATAGICSSHPLVDVDLIELVLGLDPELAYDPRHSRPLLREALAGELPDSVRLRPFKSYFDSVFHQALAGPDRPLARRLLDPAQAELSAYVDLAALDRELFDPAVKPSEAWALRLWRCLMAECWLRQQSDPEVCRRLSVEATPAQLTVEHRVAELAA
jgi:asparagine synthase (glutamine-hydrolysing)